MTVLDFSAIQKNLSARAQTLDVEVPEFGGKVRLRKLDAAAGIKLTRKYTSLEKDAKGNIKSVEDQVHYYATLVANSIVNEAGELLFLSEERIQILRNLSITALLALGNAALELNGLVTAEATADSDSTEEGGLANDGGPKDRKKTSKSARNGSSPSNSAAN